MEEVKYKQSKPMGPKIAKIRRLEGLSQEVFGEKMGGMTKSAVSRLEQSVEVGDELLKQACRILGITEEGLKSFDEESTIYLTANFFDNCSITSSAGNAPNSTFVTNSIEEIAKFYESQLEKLKKELEK